MSTNDVLTVTDLPVEDFERMMYVLISLWTAAKASSPEETILGAALEHLSSLRPGLDVERTRQTRELLIKLRNGCFVAKNPDGTPTMDANGAIILSHAVHCLGCMEKGEALPPLE